MYIQMFNLKETANSLEHMLHDFMIKGGMIVPIGKNTFKYKNYLVVRDQDIGWSVFQVGNTKKHIASTFLKVSAFAVCKAHDRFRFSTVDDVKNADAIFERNYLDSIFFKNTIKISKDYDRKDTALWRYEIVHSKARDAKEKIDRIFYSSLA